MRNVKTNQMNACRCNSKGAGVKMTSWLNNNFKLLALTLLAMLSSSVWGADSGLQPADGKFIIDFYDSSKLSSTSGTALTNSNYSNFVKVATGLTKSNVVTSVSVTGTVQYGKNGGLTAGSSTAAGANSHYVTFNIGDDYAVNKVTVYATAYESGKWQLNGTNASSGSLGSKGATFSNVTSPLVWDDLDGVTTLTFKKMGTDGGNQKRLTIYTIVCEYTTTSSCTTPPTVSSSLSNTSSTTSSITATVGITSIGGCDITENGLVYSTTNPTPTVGGTNCSKETVTACGSTAANKTVTISGLACGQSYYVCGYATNAAGTRYSNVSQISTSACPVDHFIDNIQETSGYTGDGKAVSTSYTKISITLSDKDAATSGSCEEVHYHFVGWVTAANRSAGNVDAEHIVNFQDNGNTPTGTTYYAVWAKEAE